MNGREGHIVFYHPQGIHHDGFAFFPSHSLALPDAERNATLFAECNATLFAERNAALFAFDGGLFGDANR